MRRLQIHVLQPILSVSIYRGAFRDSLWSDALWWKYPLFVWQGSAFDDVDVYDHVVLVRIPLEAESAVDPSEVEMMLKACILSCQPFYRVCLCRAAVLCYTCADWICFQRLVFWQSFELVFASFIDAFFKLCVKFSVAEDLIIISHDQGFVLIDLCFVVENAYHNTWPEWIVTLTASTRLPIILTRIWTGHHRYSTFHNIHSKAEKICFPKKNHMQS